MEWDIQYFDADTHIGYRIRTKRLTVRDALAMDTLTDDTSKREDIQGREYLLLAQDFPLVKFGTAVLETVVLDDAPVFDKGWQWPDDAAWTAQTVTEDIILDVPDLLFRAWVGAVLARNPHRDGSYEALKKRLATDAPATTNTNAIANGTPSETSSAAD
jgi:hypothetical protein